MTISIVGGTVGLVFYVFPLLGIIFAPLLIIYGFVSTYYRSTSIGGLIVCSKTLCSQIPREQTDGFSVAIGPVCIIL